MVRNGYREVTLNAAVVLENEFRTDRAWWQRIFVTIDAGDAAGFVEFLTPDAQSITRRSSLALSDGALILSFARRGWESRIDNGT
jgi:hypothetical protein